MPPLVTGPVVIQAKLKSRVNVQVVAEDPNSDPITYSLLSPWPLGAAIGEGEEILNVLQLYLLFHHPPLLDLCH